MAQPTPQTIAAAKRAAELAADVASALTRGGPAADYREEPESAYLLRIGLDDDARRKLRQALDGLDALSDELAGHDPNLDLPTDEELAQRREAALDEQARERVLLFLDSWWPAERYPDDYLVPAQHDGPYLRADDVRRLAAARL